MDSGTQDQKGSVVFLNEPKITEHEADREFNEKRKALISEVETFILRHHLFAGKSVEVTFSHSGISSLVCILDTKDEKFVLKIPLKIGYSRNEGAFLKAWESVGVSVPHVIEEGSMGEHSYTLMAFIDSLTLSKTYSVDELIEKKLYIEMGATLCKMHSAVAEGYGDLVDGKAEYPGIEDWLQDSELQEKLDYAREHKLLEDEIHGSFEQARAVLYSKIGSSASSVYAHSDFHIGNVFATTPLTVFDPIPFLNHPYMDLARSIVLAVKMGLMPVSEQMIQGYFNGESHDRQLLQAALIINAYQKIRYWHKVGRTEDVQKLQEYLVQTAHFLK